MIGFETTRTAIATDINTLRLAADAATLTLSPWKMLQNRVVPIFHANVTRCITAATSRQTLLLKPFSPQSLQVCPDDANTSVHGAVTSEGKGRRPLAAEVPHRARKLRILSTA